jgi:hypothetical protein
MAQQVDDCKLAALIARFPGQSEESSDLELLYVQQLLSVRYPIEPKFEQISDAWWKLFQLDTGLIDRMDAAPVWLLAEGAVGDETTDLWHDYWCRVLGGGDTNDFGTDFGPDFP